MSGYLCYLTNESMPNIIKICSTDQRPETLLAESNSKDEWRPPTPYQLEIAKLCTNPSHKEKTLRMILSQYTPKLCAKHGFYTMQVDDIKLLFDLIDGQTWE